MSPQFIVGICAAFVWAVIFYDDSRQNWQKTNELSNKVDNQYKVFHDEIQQEKEDIEKALDWIEHEKGRQDGIKEAKKAP